MSKILLGNFVYPDREDTNLGIKNRLHQIDCKKDGSRKQVTDNKFGKRHRL